MDESIICAEVSSIVFQNVYLVLEGVVVCGERLIGALMVCAEVAVCIVEGEEQVSLALKLECDGLDFLQQPGAVREEVLIGEIVMRFQFGFHGFAALAPGHGVQRFEVLFYQLCPTEPVVCLVLPGALCKSGNCRPVHLVASGGVQRDDNLRQVCHRWDDRNV